MVWIGIVLSAILASSALTTNYYNTEKKSLLKACSSLNTHNIFYKWQKPFRQPKSELTAHLPSRTMLMSFWCHFCVLYRPQLLQKLLFWSPQLLASAVPPFEYLSQVEVFWRYLIICFTQELLRVRLLITIICAERKEKFSSGFKELCIRPKGLKFDLIYSWTLLTLCTVMNLTYLQITN